MKRILLAFLIFIFTFLVVNSAFAVDPSGTDKSKTVIVSERVPGAECKCIKASSAPRGYDFNDTACSESVTNRKYVCTIEPGLAGFQKIFAEIIRWFVYIVMLACVLAIVGLGIAWSLAGGDDAKAKSELKKWGINILIGMIILFFFRYILQFLAPWIYK